MDKSPDMIGIEPAQSKWPLPIVVSPKDDSFLGFYVEYRKMCAVTGQGK